MKYGEGHDFRGLLKIAGLSGFSAVPTVGDAMNVMNSSLYMDPFRRREIFDQINGAGLSVKEPASRIPSVIGGALTGYYGANMLGANRFWRNTAAIGGALVGNSMFNRSHSDPNVNGGLVFHHY